MQKCNNDIIYFIIPPSENYAPIQPEQGHLKNNN